MSVGDLSHDELRAVTRFVTTDPPATYHTLTSCII